MNVPRENLQECYCPLLTLPGSKWSSKVGLSISTSKGTPDSWGRVVNEGNGFSAASSVAGTVVIVSFPCEKLTLTSGPASSHTTVYWPGCNTTLPTVVGSQKWIVVLFRGAAPATDNIKVTIVAAVIIHLGFIISPFCFCWCSLIAKPSAHITYALQDLGGHAPFKTLP